MGNPTTTLEELFLQIIDQSEAHPGRRVRGVATASGLPRGTARGVRRTWVATASRGVSPAMPIETNDFVPFLEWLLGPGWHEGGLFRAWVFWPLAVLAAVALAAAWLVVVADGVRERAPRDRRPGGGARALLATAVCGGLPARGRVVRHSAAAAASLRIRCRPGDLVRPPVAWRRHAVGSGVVSGEPLSLAAAGGRPDVGVPGDGLALAALLRGGLRYAVRTVDDALASLVADLTQLSPRRRGRFPGWRSKRRFAAASWWCSSSSWSCLLFAGWFIDPASPDPARLYLDLVLTTTGYLMLLLALFLSALSLPADIKNRTLHTVVTKPVRPSEIVLGRMLGFTHRGDACCWRSWG